MADRTEEPGKGTAALLAPAAAANRGPRRSPTTGHVRRRPHTPEAAVSATRSPRGTRSEGGPDEDAATTTEESEDGRPRPRDRGARPKRAAERGKQVAKRSQSQPSAALEPQRQSTSEDDEDYWHAYFAIQSKNIAKHNGSSLAAAAAGVLRPGPARKKAEPGAVTRKSTAERGRVMERRPSAPSFATERDDVVDAEPEAEPLPPTPKPVLRRRAPRDKSRGAAKEGPAAPPPHAASPAPASASASALGESASETSSNTSKTSKADKSIIWRKWSQAPEPTKKEVLSIDPAEVLRGLGLVEEDDPKPEPAVEAEVESVLEPEPEHTEVDSKLEPNGDGFPNRDRKSSERLSKEKKESKQAAEVVRKSSLRKERPRGDRKASLTDVKPTNKPVEKPAEKRSWLSRLFGRKPQAKHAEAKDKTPRPKVNWLVVLGDLRVEWQAFRQNHPAELRRMRAMGHRCCAALLLMMLYCGAGGLVFRFIEGSFESFYKCGVKRVKRDFIDALWTTSHNLREDEWKSRARRRLWEFEEQLHAAHEAGVTSYSGMKSWSFLNAVVYCLTVVTTIGYGHISPSTNTGRAVTIIYAIFGIPMFLILLADFGKLFTRGIKFVWSFVRRLYYTGSCRKVRRTQPVQEIMKGAQIMYDLATFRRPSMLPQEDPDPNAQDGDVEQADTPLRPEPHPPFVFRRDPADSSEPPATPAPSAFEVDDEFNLPISVAIVILLLYLFIGASIYYIWESWGFFESFYFVFISMSTIGFGDFVPQHPMYMMASIVYLVFGLALTSMCINVVQEKLSDSFRQASAKIGATIGLRMAEQEDASTNPGTPGNGPVEDEEVVERTDSKEVTS